MGETPIRRPRYERLLKSFLNSNAIKVVTGVRRCGKSTLLRMLAEDVVCEGAGRENVFYLRLDEFGVPVNPTAEWLADELRKAIEQSNPDKPFYVFLDEIQDVPGWERVVRQLHTRPDTDVYITGSNAYVMSSDLSTLIGGRYTELRIQPLSFVEYLDFRAKRGIATDNDNADAAFAEYLRFGGMPAQFELPERSQEQIARLLKTIYETVILNDVVLRTRVSDLDLLGKLVRYLFSTSGSLFSTRRIVQTLTSMGCKASHETIDNYIKALVDALILGECEQSGLAGRQVLRPLRKFYPVDTGLRNLMTAFAPRDLGFQLENVVYNELVRRGYSVTVGLLNNGEVDFVAVKGTGRIYVQVTETMVAQDVCERELSPFGAIRDSFPKYVLTLDRFRAGVTENGTHILNIIDWLTEDS